MIDPGTNPAGEEFEAYNQRRWGSSGWTHSLKSSGRAVGAQFSDWKWWPHTLKAHQLIEYVTTRAQGTGEGPSTSSCNEAIFDALYECGENVSLVDTLVQIGTERLGVPAADASDLRSHLKNDAAGRAVVRDIQTGRKKYNIRSVPYFVIGTMEPGKKPYGMSGAQDPSAFQEIFEELSS